MALTESDIPKYHEALAKANGDRHAAAKALGITHSCLHDVIRATPQLKAIWSAVMPENRGAPTPPQTFARKSKIKDVPLGISKDDLDLVKSISSEDYKFQKGFEDFGFHPDETQLAVQLQSFHGKHYARCVDLITGGLTVTSVRVMLLLQRLTDKLNTLPVETRLTGDDLDKAMAMQKMLWTQFHRCCDTLIRMSEAAANGNAIRAKIEMWRRQVNEAAQKPRPGKPAFGVLVKADNVTISEHGNGNGPNRS